ncbi:MAG: sigma factor, partial [Clostridia bacterium]
MEAVTGSGFFQEQAFCQLVTQYQLPLLRMCCIYLHDKSLAEDAVQETFLKAFKAISTFRGECSEKTWLMRIAINTCHDIKRSGWFR